MKKMLVAPNFTDYEEQINMMNMNTSKAYELPDGKIITLNSQG